MCPCSISMGWHQEAETAALKRWEKQAGRVVSAQTVLMLLVKSLPKSFQLAFYTVGLFFINN